VVQRRGAHVSTLKNGSRGTQLCFWGNLEIYADLRRELGWRLLGFGGFRCFGRWLAWGVGGGGGYLCFPEGFELIYWLIVCVWGFAPYNICVRG
jgi:hypothetical protein